MSVEYDRHGFEGYLGNVGKFNLDYSREADHLLVGKKNRASLELA